MENPRDSWNEYQALVLSELKRLDAWARDLTEKLNHHTTELAVLKFKMTVISGIAGVVTAAATQLLLALLHD